MRTVIMLTKQISWRCQFITKLSFTGSLTSVKTQRQEKVTAPMTGRSTGLHECVCVYIKDRRFLYQSVIKYNTTNVSISLFRKMCHNLIGIQVKLSTHIHFK